MNPLAIPLPLAVKRRGDVVGLVTGFVCFPIVLFLGWWEGVSNQIAVILVLPIVMVSALAGAIASAMVASMTAPAMAGAPLRAGARAGFLASLVGGAMAVLASTFHEFGIGAPPGLHSDWGALSLLVPSSRGLRVIVLALLALPPAIFFGLTGALLAGALKGDTIRKGANEEASAPPHHQRSPIFVAALALTIACYFSPLLVFLKAMPGPVIAQKPVPVTLAPSAPPPFHYEIPAGFGTASPAERIVVGEQRLHEVRADAAMALAPDGKHFAHVRSNSKSGVVIRDLSSLDVIATYPTNAEPMALAWSPNSKRLLCFLPNQLRVFDIPSRREFVLPKPKDAHLPHAHLFWWRDETVVFRPSEDPSLTLDLDMLTFHSHEDDAERKTWEPAEQERWARELNPALPSTEKWRFSVHPDVISFDVDDYKNELWELRHSLRLSQTDKSSGFSKVFPEIEMKQGTGMLIARDGSKCIRVEESGVDVFYFGLRPKPALSIHITTKLPSDVGSADLIGRKRLCAFVCSPMINPLNEKVIGPDRERVKALAVFVLWEGQAAELAIARAYG